MARSGNQKRKILYLERMLEETGEVHPITMREMIEKLAAAGIQAERKSIYDDLEELRAVGMEIIFRKVRPAGYYWKKEETAESGEGQAEAGEIEEPEDLGAKEEVREWECGHQGSGYKEVQLRLRRGCQERVRERYGENMKILKKDGKTLLAAVPEIPGPEFFGWLTSQGSGIKLCKPKESVKEYRKLLKKILDNYK